MPIHRRFVIFVIFLAIVGGRFYSNPGASHAATVYVALNGNDAWSGRLPAPNTARTDGPVATPQRARDLVRGTPDPKKIYIRGGTYYLRAPIRLTPADSGVAFLAYPGEHPVLSGGRPITGWRHGAGALWTTTIPAARHRGWIIGQVRVGDEQQTLARDPSGNPQNPASGWHFVQPNAPASERDVAALIHIDQPGDWLEWSVRAAAAGRYRVWFRYAEGMKGTGFPAPSGGSTLQTRGGKAERVGNLPITGAWDVYRWNQVTQIDLAKGKNLLHWANVTGGDFNLAAFALSDDPAWAPAGTHLPSPAAGRHLIVMQAANLTVYHAPGISIHQPHTYRTKFHFKPGDLPGYPLSSDPEIDIVPGYGWFNEILYITHLDETAHIVTVEDKYNALEQILPGNRYFVRNIREGLDTPGEWYLDQTTGLLTLWPKTLDFRRRGVVAPVLDRIFDLRGNPDKNAWVERVAIKGFQFSDTAYSRYVDPYGAIDAAVWLSGARHCIIQANRFIDTCYALRLQNQSCQDGFLDNEVVDSAEGGVVLAGANRDQPHDNEISGNWMHHLGLVYKHVVGVYGLTASRTHIAHNLIEDTPTYAITLKSFSAQSYSHRNVVEYNLLRRTCRETSDTGAINLFDNAPSDDGIDSGNAVQSKMIDSGNVIQYNRIEDVFGMTTLSSGRILSPNYAWGIYLDGYQSGVLVRGNLVIHTPRGGGFIHDGRDNTFVNNIFIDGRDDQMVYDGGNGFVQNNVFRQNIIAFKSPSILFGNIQLTWKSDSLASNDNVFWCFGNPLALDRPGITPLGALNRWRAAGYDRRSLVADPQFVNADAGDYRLRPGSPARRLGFRDLPFAQMGLPRSQIALHLGPSNSRHD